MSGIKVAPSCSFTVPIGAKSMGLSLRLIRPAFNLDQYSAALLPKSILNAPKKQTIIRVQWLVVTIASYVVLFAESRRTRRTITRSF